MEAFPLSDDPNASTLTVKSHRGEYSVKRVDDAAQAIEQLQKPGDVVIADEAALRLFPRLDQATQSLPRWTAKADEQLKSFESVGPLLAWLSEHHVTSSSRLLAIGGGAVQDLCAFTASILFRGIDWIFIPTTLLAQCDSCIGSKTSINFQGVKNQLGTFFPPRQVILDHRLLTTLDRREIQSGIGEMFHYFLVHDEETFQWASERVEQALDQPDKLGELVWKSLHCKQPIVERDEFDAGPRKVFNYGHSFGHALEASTSPRLPHGIAVAIGMDLANTLAAHLKLWPISERERVRQVIRIAWQNVSIDRIDKGQFIASLKRDKKNVGQTIRVVLPHAVGDIRLTELPSDPTVMQTIEQYLDQRQWLTP